MDLVAERARKNLSRAELAAEVAVSRQTISSTETGQYCGSRLLAVRLASVLGTTVEALCSLEGPTDAHPARP